MRDRLEIHLNLTLYSFARNLHVLKECINVSGTNRFFSSDGLLKIDLTLYTILQILSITLFEKMPILQAITTDDYRIQITSGHKQLKLFES